ncbi:Rne/Rng family ribonuclease [Rickettsiales bacterium]|nr:Rne/Rng family ribonuclease [Rickettsiales bacterium]
MTKKTIIIDAAHKDETRVAVLENNRLQDFDRDALAIKRVKGNIYLAKVTRVEASLQSAFIDYGSDRHGFLPFSDIHPDYYQLSAEEREKINELTLKSELNTDNSAEKSAPELAKSFNNYSSEGNKNEESATISSGSYSLEDETESYSKNINNIHKRYNIQDVIKPGQVILVQVLKEERGNKGASMTTYISIAGKYCVLMANTPNKGGVSKKVDNMRDRKILRSILDDLNVPSDKSVIIRTAGVGKKPEELKRDYDYLVKLWNSIRQITLESNAPSFIHAEDDVIKKSIRDVYDDSVKEVIIEGESAYNSVKSLIKLITAKSAENIKLYNERIPIFNKFKVEQQISSLYEKEVSLKSGGSIVIDHTEALVAIDVNSGRATNEKEVEKTAYNTNIEAANEVARQLRLRDLAGLVVIDFIDMYDQKNRRMVERALRDALVNDKARIQMGKISSFGLMEMSRQRLGSSFFETITDPCQHCGGTGYVRSVEILAVSILRAIRHACSEKNVGVIHISTFGEVSAYMLNYKRKEIDAIQKINNVHVLLYCSEDVGSNGFNIKKRKSLSIEERKNLDMEVKTGKVNQLGIERETFECDLNSENDNNASRPKRPRNSSRSKNRRYKNNKTGNKPKKDNKKGGLLGFLGF